MLINNSKESEIAEIMTSAIETLTDRDFVKYFVVGVGAALDAFEEQVSDMNPIV